MKNPILAFILKLHDLQAILVESEKQQWLQKEVINLTVCACSISGSLCLCLSLFFFSIKLPEFCYYMDSCFNIRFNFLIYFTGHFRRND